MSFIKLAFESCCSRTNTKTFLFTLSFLLSQFFKAGKKNILIFYIFLTLKAYLSLIFLLITINFPTTLQTPFNQTSNFSDLALSLFLLTTKCLVTVPIPIKAPKNSQDFSTVLTSYIKNTTIFNLYCNFWNLSFSMLCRCDFFCS